MFKYLGGSRYELSLSNKYYVRIGYMFVLSVLDKYYHHLIGILLGLVLC